MNLDFDKMSAAHFIFIPAVMIIGVIIGWILGSRAAQDAFAVELKRREERRLREVARAKGASHSGESPGEVA